MEQQIDADRFAYFKSPVFQARMLALNAKMEGGNMPADISEDLGCPMEEFFAYLHSIMDKDGIAYVDIGDGECISIDVGNQKSNPVPGVFPAEHYEDAVYLHSEIDIYHSALRSAPTPEAAAEALISIKAAAETLLDMLTAAAAGGARAPH